MVDWLRAGVESGTTGGEAAAGRGRQHHADHPTFSASGLRDCNTDRQNGPAVGNSNYGRVTCVTVDGVLGWYCT